MYVCICNAITDKQILEAADAGASDLWALQRELGVATGCGTCRDSASAILAEHRAGEAANESAQPRLYSPRSA